MPPLLCACWTHLARTLRALPLRLLQKLTSFEADCNHVCASCSVHRIVSFSLLSSLWSRRKSRIL